MRRWLPHIGIALGVLIAVYALFFAESDEDLIRARLADLAQAVEVHGQENPVLRGARVRKAFTAIFVDEVHFEIPELSGEESGRADLVKLAAAAPRLYRQAAVDLSDLRIDVDEEGLSAIAHGEARLRGTGHDGSPKRDTRTVSLRFDKIEDEWRVISLSVSLRSESQSR